MAKITISHKTEQEAQMMLTNPCNAFRGQSRSPNVVPFHMLCIVSSCAIVTLSLRRAIFLIFDFKKCHDLEIRIRGHWRSLKMVPFDRLCMDGFLLVFFSHFVPKMRSFWDIWHVSILWPWNLGLGSLNIIENDTIQSSTHDFLLSFMVTIGLFRTVSEINGDLRRKLPIFPTPVYFASLLKGIPLELAIVTWVRRN